MLLYRGIFLYVDRKQCYSCTGRRSEGSTVKVISRRVEICKRVSKSTVVSSQHLDRHENLNVARLS